MNSDIKTILASLYIKKKSFLSPSNTDDATSDLETWLST